MSKINVLSENIANIIAAGEVVDRPASVVKELIENSIDARASKIIINIEDAGKKLIEVIDNGEGMDYEDARKSLIRHATSKIVSKSDLFSIKSLGFRGEAIPSIASVSRFSIETSTGIGSGIKIMTEANKIIKEEVTNSRKGTRISVHDLFFNTPARYKFMKSDQTEIGNIINVVNKCGLGYPMVNLELYIDNKLTLSLSGNGQLVENIGVIYGTETAKELLEIKSENFDFQISGYIGKPQVNKANRNFINLFLNHRSVRIYSIQNKIIEAYGTLLPPSRYPFAVINIDIDPRLVDVNVHPSKQEVKLSKEQELEVFIYNEVKKALSNKIFTPNALQKKPIVSMPVMIKEPIESSISTINNNTEFEITEMNKPSFTNPFAKYERNENRLNNIGNYKEEIRQTTSKFESNEQLAMELFPEERNSFDIRPIGQIKDTYIIAVTATGYYLIDQHAAMERINYEKFYKLMTENKSSTISLIPPLVEIANNDLSIFFTRLELLKEIGLTFEHFGANSFRLVEYPVWLSEVNIDIYLDEIIHMVITNNLNIEQLRRKAVATIACKASLKANKEISLMEMEILIKRLFECKDPSTCPHGRPTMIFYPFYEIEKLFKRTGF